MSLRIRYQTIEVGDLDIHLRTLRDRQQYADAGGVAERLGIFAAHWPLFGVIWESSKQMAALGYSHSQTKVIPHTAALASYTGQVLRYQRL